MSLDVYIITPDSSAIIAENMMRNLYRQGYGVASSNQYGSDLDTSRMVIHAADVTLLLLTPETSESRRVRAEVSIAQHSEKPLIPVLVKGDQIPAMFANSTVDMRMFKQTGYQRLLARLRTYHPQETAFTVPPIPAGIYFLLAIVMFVGFFVGVGLMMSHITM